MSPPSPWSIRVVRAIYFALTVFTGIIIAHGLQYPAWTGALIGAGFMGILLTLDRLFVRFTMRDFSHATFGLLIGLFCAWLVTRVGIFQLTWFKSIEEGDSILNMIEIIVYAALSFFGITFALRSERDQFAVVIPYVRFRRDSSEGEPLLLDSNIIIDGRVQTLMATGFLSSALVVPRFVLDELQRLADSRDPIKSDRGKRGLEEVRLLRENRHIELTVHEELPRAGEGEVDTMLVSLARDLNARLLTNDENLAKVARLRNITVLSLNELTLAIQPRLAPGDRTTIQLAKPGKDKHQAVGYLHDGTMIVVNHAADRIGQTLPVIISSALPTAAGRLYFAELAA
ncbi:MAG: PIN domain-containing protein [Verrucomicrobiaceae bacterium]|nr:PIN domain-containing protein [Verrucomicrobiaceae bacterium]